MNVTYNLKLDRIKLCVILNRNMNKRIQSSGESPDDIPSINGRTWQDILNELVNKAMNDGLVKKINNEKTLEGKLSTVMNSVTVR